MAATVTSSEYLDIELQYLDSASQRQKAFTWRLNNPTMNVSRADIQSAFTSDYSGYKFMSTDSSVCHLFDSAGHAISYLGPVKSVVVQTTTNELT